MSFVKFSHLILLLSICIAFGFSKPTAKQGVLQKEELEFDLEKELAKLKPSKTSKPDSINTANSEKEESKAKNNDPRVFVPASGANEISHNANDEDEKVDLVPVDEVAKYIFDTSDVDGVKSAIESLIQEKKITKEVADQYMNQIRDKLNEMHEAALKAMMAEMEEKKQIEDQALVDMYKMADSLNTNQNTEDNLYQYIKQLYLLYKTEGDEYAKEILTKYITSIHDAGSSGGINMLVQNNIYNVILKALNDVNNQLGDKLNQQQDQTIEKTKIDAQKQLKAKIAANNEKSTTKTKRCSDC